MAATAHELRGPIAVMIDLVEALASAPADTVERSRMLAGILRLARLLDGTAADLRTDDPGALCIDVADQGPGVPSELVDRLFLQFSRAEGTDVNGTGLGLYVVRSLAAAQGGAVGYAPGPHGGAAFTLTLPARPR